MHQVAHISTNIACFINQLGEELSLVWQTSQITSYTGNKSLHDDVNTTSQISYSRFHVELSAIREIQERKKYSINEKRQIADCLCKKAASCISILATLKTENYIKPKFLITVLNVNIIKINMQKIFKNYNEHNRLIWA